MPEAAVVTPGQVIRYTAEPTLARFHGSDAFVRGVRGPIGSGKSVAMVIECLARASRQAPDANGIRPSRGAIVRNTYPELKTTTIRTWQQWVPESVCPIRWGAPIDALLRLPLADGTVVEAEIMFLALDRESDVKKLLSLELTWAWLNEAREINAAVVHGVTSRVGRFPEKARCPLTWSGVFMDTNAPTDDHWWPGIFEMRESDDPVLLELREQGWAWDQFVQPPALLRVEAADGSVRYEPNPRAENVKHQQLGFDYWRRMLWGKPEPWIRVYVLGEYGSVEAGKPCYPEWSESLHLRRTDYRPPKGARIGLGWDYGLTPACVFWHLTPAGVLEVFDEVVAARAGIRALTEAVNLHIAAHYPDLEIDLEYGDPAGTAAAQTDERSCFDIQRDLGHQVRPGATTLTDRLDGVRWFLTRLVDGHAGLRLSPRCKMLRRGFEGGYKFREMQITLSDGDRAYADKPEKNRYSHPHDALNHAVGKLAFASRTAERASVAADTTRAVLGDRDDRIKARLRGWL